MTQTRRPLQSRAPRPAPQRLGPWPTALAAALPAPPAAAEGAVARTALVLFLILAMLLLLALVMLVLLTIRRRRRRGEVGAARAEPDRDAWSEAGRRAEPFEPRPPAAERT